MCRCRWPPDCSKIPATIAWLAQGWWCSCSTLHTTFEDQTLLACLGGCMFRCCEVLKNHKKWCTTASLCQPTRCSPVRKSSSYQMRLRRKITCYLTGKLVTFKTEPRRQGLPFVVHNELLKFRKCLRSQCTKTITFIYFAAFSWSQFQ